MNNIVKSFFYLLLLVPISVWAEDQMIPIVGLTADGKVLEDQTTEKEYAERLESALQLIQKSTFTAIEHKKEGISPWALRSVVVGIGVNAEAGLGPIIKFGALPRIRVGFSNAKEPSFP